MQGLVTWSSWILKVRIDPLNSIVSLFKCYGFEHQLIVSGNASFFLIAFASLRTDVNPRFFLIALALLRTDVKRSIQTHNAGVIVNLKGGMRG